MRLSALFIAPILFFVTLAVGQEEIEKIPYPINTDDYDETSPVVSRDGLRLFFTRTADPAFETTLLQSDGRLLSSNEDENYVDRLAHIYSQISGQDIADPIRSMLNQDIWMAPIHDDTINSLIHPGFPLNNGLPNSLVSTGMYTHEYILLNEFHRDGSMYAGFSRVNIDNEGRHTFPAPMHIYGFDKVGADVNMTMTPTGQVVVLSMEGPASLGQKDFYVSFYVRDNVWSAPVHMGNVLNSPYRESSPYITPDKKYLYFSSNRPDGVGGHDIYVSERLDYTWLNWTEPVLVKGDINSPSDESHPYFDPQRNYLYFTSRRDGGSDIFRQRLTPRPKLDKPVVVKGRIVNSETGNLVRGEVFWGQQSSKEYMEYFSSYNGEFELTMTEFDAYKFQLRKPNHTAQKVTLDPRSFQQSGNDTMMVTFYLDPKDKQGKPEAPVVKKYHDHQSRAEEVTQLPASFYEIFFVKTKAEILSKSTRALSYLTEYMHRYPGIEILIIGHTDNVGDDDALQTLSLRRAEAIKEHLVLQGVNPARIQVAGKGASEPAFNNSTEGNRERNRRVEIQITKS